MPKINAIHKVERMRKRIEQLERGDALEARDINVLLTPKQQKQLKTAWVKQQALRKIHNPPKTDEERVVIGWKTIREVRLEVYRQALDDLLNNLVEEMEKIQNKSEVRAGNIFMEAFSDAHKNVRNGWSEGNNALTRAHFNRMDGKKSTYRTARDRQVNEIEENLRKRFESELNAEDKEQFNLSRQHEKSKGKSK